MSLFLLECLQNIQELLVGIRIVPVACLDLVKVLDGMVELFSGLLLLDGFLVAVVEVIEE